MGVPTQPSRFARIKNSNERGGGACVSILTEPEDKMYRVSFFMRRRIDDNMSYCSGINKQVAWQERHFD